MTEKTKILIVDDSGLMRKIVRNIFATSDNMEVVGEAVNGSEALELLPRLKPDVIVLDVNMPGMDGITTLKHMMIKHPTPTVMLSALTKDGAVVTFDSLKYGAVDFLAKPSSLDGDLNSQATEIAKKVATAAGVELEAMQFIRTSSASSRPATLNSEIKKVVAIGAAEGGYNALLKFIPRLEPDLAAAFIAILYTEPENVDAFVSYLNQCSPMAVKRAREGAPLKTGVCYIGSGNEYVTIRRQDGDYLLHVSQAPFSTRRGSIDMLMLSTAEIAGRKSIGVILSGNGGDGAEGLSEIIAHGGEAIVQKPQSCPYREMPEKALARCRTRHVVADAKLASAINLCCI